MWPSLCCFCGGGVREKSSGGGGGGRGPSSSTATVKFEEDAADSSTRDTGGEVGPNTKSDSPPPPPQVPQNGDEKATLTVAVNMSWESPIAVAAAWEVMKCLSALTHSFGRGIKEYRMRGGSRFSASRNDSTDDRE